MVESVQQRTVLIDWDGTVTDRDMLDEIARTFGDPELYAQIDAGLDERTLTLHEVLRREFEPVRAPLAEVEQWLVENARIRPGFHELVQLSEERGWRLVVLSSGFRQLIEPVLRRERLERLELVSNRIVPDPQGWRVVFRDEDICPVCGEACKRQTVRKLLDGRGGEIIYIGDGYSDQCAAQAADRIFARRRLASYLLERGVPFEPFDDFFQVARGIVAQ